MVVSCKQNDRKTAENKTDRNQIILDSIYRAEKFDSIKDYKPLSLNYKGNPILRIGQKTSELDSTLSYRMDPNMDYQGFENLITDYLSIDDNLLIELGNYSSLNGIAFFSADRKSKRIFNVSASWYFDLNMENMEKKEKTEKSEKRESVWTPLLIKIDTSFAQLFGRAL